MHYDLYRLKNHKDILELGMFENAKEQITIIEWPEIIKKKPKNRIELYFKYSKYKENRYLKLLKFGNLKKHEFRL